MQWPKYIHKVTFYLFFAHYFIYIPTILYVHLSTSQKQYSFCNLGNFKYSRLLLKIQIVRFLTKDIHRSSLCSQKVSKPQAAVYASSVILSPVELVMLIWSLRSSLHNTIISLNLKWHFISAIDWLSHHDKVGIHAVVQWSLSLPHTWKPYFY